MKNHGHTRHILRTKLHTPAAPPDLVARPRLLERLNQGRHQSLILVSAPAGYGKSTLVSHWLETCECPTAWLSLDEEDNDLRLFLTYFLEAVRTIFPTAGRDTLAMLNAPTLPPLLELSRSLINELDSMEQEFVLVLDDYHRIQEDSVQRVLTELLRHPPQPIVLVLAGRRDPSLPLSSLRARGGITEIRAQDLRFTVSETDAFLQQVLEDRIEEATAAAWAEKTEGWVTGLRLAAVAQKQLGDTDTKLLEVKGTIFYVMDYFLTEVIKNQPLEIRGHLLRTAILDRFSAPLCDVLSGPGVEPGESEIDGEGFIRWMQRNHLFLIPLDLENQWFRYHHLFQDLLHNQLKRNSSTQEIATLHRQASVWFDSQGLIEEALQHAMAAEDVSYAVHLVDQHRYDLMNREQWNRLERMLRMLPPETVEKNPILLITQAYVYEHRGQLTESFAYRDQAESLLSTLQSGSLEQKAVQGEIAALHGEQHIISGEADLAIESAERALRLVPPEALHIWSYAIGEQVLAHQTAGDIGRGLKIINEILKERALLPGISEARMMLWFCMSYWMEGDLNGLKQPALRYLKLGEQCALPESISFARYFLGALHYVRNELAEAERYLASVVDDPYISRPQYLVQSACALALIYTRQGRDEEASNIVESVISHTMETNDTRPLATARAFQLELALRRGQVLEAQRLGEHATYDPFPPIWFFYIPQLTPIKLLIAQNTPESLEKALILLDQLDGYLRKTNRKAIRIDLLALQALILDAQGKEPAAIERLRESLALAKPGGFIRNFVDLGPPMAELLKRAMKQALHRDYVGEILAAFLDDKPGPVRDAPNAQSALAPAMSPQPLIEPLTDREFEILNLLKQRIYNREIADRLFVSTETVKTHLTNIYQKLQVKTRREAVDKARKLGILDDG